MSYRDQTKKKQKEKGILKQTGGRLMETQNVNNSQIGGSQVLFPDSQSSIQSFGRNMLLLRKTNCQTNGFILPKIFATNGRYSICIISVEVFACCLVVII